MTRLQASAVRFVALMLLLQSALPAFALCRRDDPVPHPLVGIVVASTELEDEQLAVVGGALAPPGSTIVIVGVPGQGEVELELNPEGGFSEVFPIPPGSSGTLEIHLYLPNGLLADSTTLTFG